MASDSYAASQASPPHSGFVSSFCVDTRQAVNLSKQFGEREHSGVLGCCLACGGSAGIAASVSCSNSVDVLGCCVPHALISSGRSIRTHLFNLLVGIFHHLVYRKLAALFLRALPGFEGCSGLLILLLVDVPACLPGGVQTPPSCPPAAAARNSSSTPSRGFQLLASQVTPAPSSITAPCKARRRSRAG